METLKLIALWSEDSIQAMLEGCKRNKDVFSKLAKQMEAAGIHKTADQCNRKINKLKYEYRKIKDSNARSGSGRKEWKFYNAMDNVLGHRPATRPPVIVESSSSSMSPEEELSTSLLPTPPPSSVLSERIILENDGVGDGEVAGSSSGDVAEQKKKIVNKKRKKSIDKFQKIEGLVDKVIKLQEDSDNRYLKLEERMLELEEKRFKETQELQLRMLSMLCNHAPNFRSSPASHPLVYPPTNYIQPMYSFENPPDNQQE